MERSQTPIFVSLFTLVTKPFIQYFIFHFSHIKVILYFLMNKNRNKNAKTVKHTEMWKRFSKYKEIIKETGNLSGLCFLFITNGIMQNLTCHINKQNLDFWYKFFFPPLEMLVAIILIRHAIISSQFQI